MALPTSLGHDSENENNGSIDNTEVIAIPADFKTLLRETSREHDAMDEVNHAVDQINAGELVPSWKNAIVESKTKSPIASTPLIGDAYKPIGELSAQTVIDTPYEEFRHLEGIVQDITTFVQKQLTDNNKLHDITRARAKEDNMYNEMVRYLDQMILNHMTRKAMGSPADTKIIVAMVINEILGLGPIQPLWGDPDISEIMINGAEDIRIEKKGKIQKAHGIQFRSQAHLIEVCQQLLGEIGRRIDVAHPLEDGRLRDMSRINVTHPAVGPHGPYVTIRRFSDTAFSMEKLVQMNSMNEEMAHVVGNLVHSGLSIVIAGGTGSGKTSMLNALSGCIGNNDRLITIEDNLELRLHKDKFVASLEARPASASGEGAITIRDLVKNTLRMRPDRIIVGEIRDASAYDMLQAMNTGHDGSLTTVHAEDAVGAVERLRNLVDQEGSFNSKTAMTLIAGGVDLFITINRYEDGSRRVSGIYEVPRNIEYLDNGEIILDPIPLWEFVHESTTAKGEVIGHYEKMNELSESIIRRRRLDRKRKLSLEELYELSKVEDRVAATKTEQQQAETHQAKSTHNVDIASTAPKRPARPSKPSLNDFSVERDLLTPEALRVKSQPRSIDAGASNVIREVPIQHPIPVTQAKPIVIEPLESVAPVANDAPLDPTESVTSNVPTGYENDSLDLDLDVSNSNLVEDETVAYVETDDVEPEALAMPDVNADDVDLNDVDSMEPLNTVDAMEAADATQDDEFGVLELDDPDEIEPLGVIPDKST